MDLVEKHRTYQNRNIDWQRIEGKAIKTETPYCLTCGCLGNNECGHDPLLVDCALSAIGCCECCFYVTEL